LLGSQGQALLDFRQGPFIPVAHHVLVKIGQGGLLALEFVLLGLEGAHLGFQLGYLILGLLGQPPGFLAGAIRRIHPLGQFGLGLVQFVTGLAPLPAEQGRPHQGGYQPGAPVPRRPSGGDGREQGRPSAWGPWRSRGSRRRVGSGIPGRFRARGRGSGGRGGRRGVGSVSLHGDWGKNRNGQSKTGAPGGLGGIRPNTRQGPGNPKVRASYGSPLPQAGPGDRGRRQGHIPEPTNYMRRARQKGPRPPGR